jgi:hypothetical protein
LQVRSARETCCICGKVITVRKWVCDACEDAYGLAGPFREWPETRARISALSGLFFFVFSRDFEL